MEAEVGAMRPCTEEYQEPLEAWQGRKDFP